MSKNLLRIAQEAIRSKIKAGDLQEIATGIFVSTSKGAVKTIFHEIGELMALAESEKRDLSYQERQNVLEHLRRLTKFIEDYQ